MVPPPPRNVPGSHFPRPHHSGYLADNALIHCDLEWGSDYLAPPEQRPLTAKESQVVRHRLQPQAQPPWPQDRTQYGLSSSLPVMDTDPPCPLA